eukprot:GILJ01004570.1.p1 GENE.GILJ01004570.1~~GILJ01004570.1.p1  ORF type:complete len:619 (+),score=141.10 GILJ01004570.1:35-1858(+)
MDVQDQDVDDVADKHVVDLQEAERQKWRERSAILHQQVRDQIIYCHQLKDHFDKVMREGRYQSGRNFSEWLPLTLKRLKKEIRSISLVIKDLLTDQEVAAGLWDKLSDKIEGDMKTIDKECGTDSELSANQVLNHLRSFTSLLALRDKVDSVLYRLYQNRLDHFEEFDSSHRPGESGGDKVEHHKELKRLLPDVQLSGQVKESIGHFDAALSTGDEVAVIGTALCNFSSRFKETEQLLNQHLWVWSIVNGVVGGPEKAQREAKRVVAILKHVEMLKDELALQTKRARKLQKELSHSRSVDASDFSSVEFLMESTQHARDKLSRSLREHEGIKIRVKELEYYASQSEIGIESLEKSIASDRVSFESLTEFYHPRMNKLESMLSNTYKGLEAVKMDVELLSSMNAQSCLELESDEVLKQQLLQERRQLTKDIKRLSARKDRIQPEIDKRDKLIERAVTAKNQAQQASKSRREEVAAVREELRKVQKQIRLQDYTLNQLQAQREDAKNATVTVKNQIQLGQSRIRDFEAAMAEIIQESPTRSRTGSIRSRFVKTDADLVMDQLLAQYREQLLMSREESRQLYDDLQQSTQYIIKLEQRIESLHAIMKVNL